MFKKPKPTFLSKAGRQGAPSARKPFAKKNSKKTLQTMAASKSKKTTRGPIGKAKVVRNGHPLKTGKMKGTINSFNTGKSFPMKRALSIDQRLDKYFKAVGPKLTSATNSPQSAPQAYKPRG